MNSFIKSLMEEKGLKQKELATILGLSPAAVSQWNEEGTNITADNLFLLSKLFHVTVDELLEGKRTGESLEDKWKREYDINEDAAKTALVDGEKEKVLNYFAALQRANIRFFELFEKKISNSISDNELKEWEYLKQFYDVNMYRSHFLNEVRVNRIDSVSEMILNTLIDKIGADNSKAIIWELQKIYHITLYDVGISTDREVIPVGEYFNYFGDNPLEYLEDDEDVFFAVYNAISPIEKDQFLSTEFQNKKGIEYLFKLIKHGGKILYTYSDLNIMNYDFKDLEEIKGEIIPVQELDKAYVAIKDICNNYSLATYEQYQALINRARMRQIEMEAKYKEKNPIEYWEYIKKNEVLI